MPRIHVCPLARIDEIVAATGARSLVTLLNPGTPVERPAAIRPERHLYIGVLGGPREKKKKNPIPPGG